MGLEQQWAKGGLPLRTLGGQAGARAGGGWQMSKFSEADNCMEEELLTTQGARSTGVLQAEGVMTHLKPIANY